MKFRSVGAELFHAGWRAGGRAEGWTDGQIHRRIETHDEDNIRFSAVWRKRLKQVEQKV
jgi:hypothetical protein